MLGRPNDNESGPAALTIALAGNPNAGKTSLFNRLTGGRQRVGNWPGVTVEKREGFYDDGRTRVAVVDLPGAYAVGAYTPDEAVARDYLRSGEAEVVVTSLMPPTSTVTSTSRFNYWRWAFASS